MSKFWRKVIRIHSFYSKLKSLSDDLQMIELLIVTNIILERDSTTFSRGSSGSWRLALLVIKLLIYGYNIFSPSDNVPTGQKYPFVGKRLYLLTLIPYPDLSFSLVLILPVSHFLSLSLK
jgi:hypothetical protein